jgi:polar amino acid transport system permease protein
VSSYVVFLAILAVLVSLADWENLSKNFLRADVAATMFPMVWRAAFNTLWYTAASFVAGTILGTVFALMKMSKGPLKWFAVAYIELFRGLPAMLTILLMAFAIPIAFSSFKIPSTISALVALSLVSSAYTAEIIRSGIEAVAKGQREAARSLGMTHMQTTMSVILPQAFRIVIPPLTNELVLLLKDTSLFFAVGATKFSKELLQFGRDAGTTNANFTPYMVVAVFYLVITIPLTWLVSKLEKKMAVKK